ncbi:MAG: glycosyltransferase family 39 protein [Chloroflexi bacterium]|nr:glycosyltransferase family 39 protein [Chloroflexota bacterium]
MSKSRAADALALASIVFLVFAVYGDALHYTFMFDDAIDLPRASGRSLLSIFTSAGESGYYRPLPLLVWNLMYRVLGYHSPFWLHLLSLLLHAANGELVYLLARKWLSRGAAAAGAALFVIYPFSYQAVPNVNALFHLTVTLFLLTAVFLNLEASQRHSRTLFLASLSAAALALLSHENGVVAMPLILTMEAYLFLSQGRRPTLYPLAYLGLAAAFGGLWQVVPKWPTGGMADLASLKLNGLFFLQGLVYPWGRLMGWAASYPRLSPELTVALATFVTLPFLTFIIWKGKKATGFWIGIVWFVAGVLPAGVNLPFSYVIDGPRLLYLASVGAALAWAAFVDIWLSRKTTPWGYLLPLAILAFIAATSLNFIEQRKGMYSYASQLLRQGVAETRAPQDQGLLYLNFPSWLAPREDEYPFVHTGVLLAPVYLSLERALYINGAATGAAVESLSYAAIAMPWQYNYGFYGRPVEVEELNEKLRQGATVLVTDFLPQGLSLRPVGYFGPPSDSSTSYVAQFGDSLRLEKAEIRDEGEALLLTLRWSATRPVKSDYTVFAHLYDDQGRLVAQRDGYPMGGISPPRLWRPEEVITEFRPILPPPSEGRYTVKVGIYSGETGQRMTAVDEAGQRYADDAVFLGQITIGARPPLGRSRDMPPT